MKSSTVLTAVLWFISAVMLTVMVLDVDKKWIGIVTCTMTILLSATGLWFVKREAL